MATFVPLGPGAGFGRLKRQGPREPTDAPMALDVLAYAVNKLAYRTTGAHSAVLAPWAGK